MTDADLIAQTRVMCGKFDNSKELADADILTASVWILKKIGDWIHVRALRYITSVANQREYAVHEDCVRVKRVYPAGSIDENLLELGSHKVAEDSTASDYYNSPSLWSIKMMKQWRSLPRINYSFNPISRKLAIDPFPLQADIKYWYASIEKVKWTVVLIPEAFENVLVLGTSWYGLEITALARSRLGGVHRDGGKVQYPITELKKFVDSRKDEFYNELRVLSKLYNKR